MKKITYSFFLVAIFFISVGCGDKKNNSAIENNSHTAIIESEFSRLKSELQILRKEMADAPEPEQDPEKLAAMTQEERMAIQDVLMIYTAKKQMLIQQTMDMVEEINIEKSIATDGEDLEALAELDALLNSIIEFQKELQPVQAPVEHIE